MYEVQCVLFSLLFNPKVVYHEGKIDSILVVAPQSQSDWIRLISECSEMFLERHVCCYACLYQTIHSLLHPNI